MTKIPYLDEMWSITTGCGDDQVSPGCLNCYARRMFGRNLWKCPECDGSGGYLMTGPPAELNGVCECPVCHGTSAQDFTPTFHASRLDQPLHWRKPRVVGVSFMGDLFHEAITDEQRDSVFIRFAMCPGWGEDPGPDDAPRTGAHTFLVLTKRADAMHRYLTDPDRWWKLEEAVEREGFMGETADLIYDNTKGHATFPNVHLGVTVCNQEEADRNIPILLDTPATKRWVSLEPMLEAVDLRPWLAPAVTWPKTKRPKLKWVVLGGETGPGARPMNPAWALDVYRQCQAAGVPFWFKQWGSNANVRMTAGVVATMNCHESPGTP